MDAGSVPHGPPPDARFVRRWIGWVTLGESAGFLAPVLAFLLATRFSLEAVPVFVVAGAAEGAVLGWAQARVLAREIPALSVRRWIIGTSLAAAVAWLIGQSAGESGEVIARWPVPAVVAAAAVAGPLLLGAIGFAQWLELRRHLRRSAWWIAGSAAAWLVGLAVFFSVAPPLWQSGQPTPLIVAIGVAGGVLMAVSMAAVSGAVMRGLLRQGVRADR